MAYATGADLVARYDVDIVGALASDDREPADHGFIPLLPHVAAALDDASGEIDVALLAGGRYRTDQLAGLTGYSAKHLVRITCAIAMSLLFQRRLSSRYQEESEQVAKQAREHLNALRAGQNVFGLPAHVDAGNIEHTYVTAPEIENLNLLPARMSRFFPVTEQRTPRG